MILSNPVSNREINDILNNRRSTYTLFLYILGLGATVSLAWPRDEQHVLFSTEIARTIFDYFAFSQLLLVSIFAPVFSAGSLTHEKEGDTWELLIASPISVRGIVWGKMLSALTFLFLLVASSFPISLSILALGGISTNEILGLYIVLAGISILFTTIGVGCSARFHRTHASLVVSYLVILPILTLIVLPIFGHATVVANINYAASWMAVCVVGATVLFGKICIDVTTNFQTTAKPAGEEDVGEQSGLVLRKDKFPDFLFLPEKTGIPIGDDDDPIYRKEMRSELLGSGTLFVRIILQISIVLSILLIGEIVRGRTQNFFIYVITVMTLITPALACGSFSQEAERGTLDVLLMTLLEPRQLVRGKLKALMRYAGTIAIFLVGAHLVTFLFTLQNRPAPLSDLDRLCAYLVILAVSVVSATSVSTFFSLATLNTFLSTLLTYVTLVILYAGPFVAYKLLEIFSSLELSSIRWITLTSPYGPLLLFSSEGLCRITPAAWHAFVLFHLCLTFGSIRWMDGKLHRMQQE